MAIVDQLAPKPAEAGQYNPAESDLASGRLAQFDNFSNPVFKRAGSLASRAAGARGLTNSSISVGNAQGAVLDRAVDISLADSNSLVTSGNSNAGNRTQTSVANANNATSIQQQLLADKGASERLGKQLESTEREGAANRGSSEKINLAQIASTEGISSAQRALDEKLTGLKIDANTADLIRDISAREGMAAAQRELDLTISQTREDTERYGIDQSAAVSREGQAANERIADASNATSIANTLAGVESNNRNADLNAAVSREDIAATNGRSEKEIANRTLIEKLGNESAFKIEEMRAKYQVDGQGRDDVSRAWDGLQSGIANIDPNASVESQRTQFNRLTDSFDARMGYLDSLRGTKDGLPVSASTSTTTSVAQGVAQTPPPTQSTATTTSGYTGGGGGGGSSTYMDRSNVDFN